MRLNTDGQGVLASSSVSSAVEQSLADLPALQCAECDERVENRATPGIEPGTSRTRSGWPQIIRMESNRMHDCGRCDYEIRATECTAAKSVAKLGHCEEEGCGL